MSEQKLLHGDVTEQLKTLPNNSVDSIITDPPYNIKMDDWDAFPTDWEFSDWITEWATEAYRVLRPGGTIAVFSAARTYHYMAIALDKAGFKCRDMIEWVYWSGMPKGKNLKQCHEPIYLGWKPEKDLKNLTFNIDACRIPVKEKTKKNVGPVIEINGKVEIPVEKSDGLLEY